MTLQIITALTLASLMLTGCFTPRKEKEIKDDIFDVKSRLIELERTSEKGQTAEASNRRHSASAQSEMERMNMEIQRMKGELDSIKAALRTGDMPGADPEAESIGKRLRDLQTRIETLETAGPAKPAAKPSPAADKKVSVTDIRNAFNNKKFTFVVTNVDTALNHVKTKTTREELSYYEAESLFRLSRYRDAALKYSDFTEQFTGSARLAHAKMRLGDAFKNLGDKDAAKSYYKEIISKYPKTEESTRAKEQLESLESKGASRYNRSPKTKYSGRDSNKNKG